MESIRRPKYDLLTKTIIIGDSGVGKTCMLLRFSEDYFPTSLVQTTGIDFKIKTVRVCDKNVKMQLWDTAGQERFRIITQTYYRSVSAIVLVYDCTDLASFKNVRAWMMQIKANATKDAVVILVANKIDSPNAEVLPEEAQELADEYGIPFFQTSAKTGEGVDEVFMYCAKELVHQKWDYEYKWVQPEDYISRKKLTLAKEVHKPKPEGNRRNMCKCK